MKAFLILLVVACCTGCATRPSTIETHVSIPPGAEALLEKAYRIVDAYQRDDATAWSELVCSKDGLSKVKFLGTFTSPRLVSVAAVSAAGNANREYRWPVVAIEVKAERYPVGNLLLRFVEIAEERCVAFLF